MFLYIMNNIFLLCFLWEGSMDLKTSLQALQQRPPNTTEKLVLDESKLVCWKWPNNLIYTYVNWNTCPNNKIILLLLYCLIKILLFKIFYSSMVHEYNNFNKSETEWLKKKWLKKMSHEKTLFIIESMFRSTHNR